MLEVSHTRKLVIGSSGAPSGLILAVVSCTLLRKLDVGADIAQAPWSNFGLGSSKLVLFVSF